MLRKWNHPVLHPIELSGDDWFEWLDEREHSARDQPIAELPLRSGLMGVEGAGWNVRIGVTARNRASSRETARTAA